MDKNKNLPVNWTKLFHMLCSVIPQMGSRWFFCFGTMLTLVRDKGKFPDRDDVDIGVFYEETGEECIRQICQLCGLKENKRITNDIDKKPLYVSLSPNKDCAQDVGDVHIDIFFWYKHRKQRYHTYDINFESPKSGIPKTYYFKGIDASLLEEYARIENISGSMMEGKIPLRYGTLLDIWYPHWLQRRKEVSAAPYILKCKSCSELHANKYEKVQWPESV